MKDLKKLKINLDNILLKVEDQALFDFDFGTIKLEMLTLDFR